MPTPATQKKTGEKKAATATAASSNKNASSVKKNTSPKPKTTSKTNKDLFAVIETGVITLNKRFSQSKYLVQSIGFLLNSLELKRDQLDGIAVSIGPGSYTGLRIGLSVAKALAYSFDIPLAAINSLDAFSQLARGTEGLVCPMIRFRRNEYYHAFYAWNGSEVERQSEYRAEDFAKIISIIGTTVTLTGEEPFFAPARGQMAVLYDDQGLITAAGEICSSGSNEKLTNNPRPPTPDEEFLTENGP